ncbi:MAG TPA: hypothetical protein GXZ28_06665 [Clostridiales bacterium]|nr:hypothetical protein [Clostridiales bacterium]
MSKQSNQRYRKEVAPGHKERAKNSYKNQNSNRTSNSVENMPSREGYGDGNPYGFSDNTENNNK